MKTNYISKKFVSVLLMVLLFVISASPLMAADCYFEKGKKYHIECLGKNGDVLVLSKPDDFGWIKVKVLSGNFKKYISNEGLVNITTGIIAKEIK